MAERRCGRHHGGVRVTSPVLTATLPSPWGPLHGAASARGIVALAMLTTQDAFVRDLARRWWVDPTEPTRPHTSERDAAARHLAILAAELAAYFDGRSADLDGLPLDLVVGSAWDADVLAGVRGIPFGAVDTNGGVARRIVRAGAARAVGGAVGRNPIASLVPCHRVVAAGGRIGGYGGDWYGTREERLAIKRDLLRLEGIVLRDDVPSTGARA